MLALVVAGVLDWIVGGVLFLTMEFLGELVRGLFLSRPGRRPAQGAVHGRDRPATGFPDRRGASGGRLDVGGGPGRKRPDGRDLMDRRRRTRSTPTGKPTFRVLVPPREATSRACLTSPWKNAGLRRAELIVLFLRPPGDRPLWARSRSPDSYRGRRGPGDPRRGPRPRGPRAGVPTPDDLPRRPATGPPTIAEVARASVGRRGDRRLGPGAGPGPAPLPGPGRLDPPGSSPSEPA